MSETVTASPAARRPTGFLLITAGAVVAVLLVVATAEFVAIHRQRDKRTALQAQAETLRGQIRSASKRTQESTQRTATARAEVNRLAAAARSDAELDREVDAWLGRAGRLRDAARRPDLTLPEVALLNDDDWFNLARDTETRTEEQLRKAYEQVRKKARARAGLAIRRALMRYADANGGALPASAADLASHASLPAEILERCQVNARGFIASQGMSDWLIVETGPFADRDSSRLVVRRGGYGAEGYDAIPSADLRAAVASYAQQHSGRPPATAADVMPFFAQPLHPDAAKALLAKSPADFAADIKKAHGDD